MAKTESPFTVRLDSKQARALTQAAVRAGGFDQLKAADVERITQALDGEPAPAAKPSKYRNVRTVVDGETFDSKKEAQHWHELKLREQAGDITELRRQVEFPLYTACLYEVECPLTTASDVPSVEHDPRTAKALMMTEVTRYIADFVFIDRDGRQHVQDVKGGRATQTQLYKLKKKWLSLQSGIEIEEI